MKLCSIDNHFLDHGAMVGDNNGRNGRQLSVSSFDYLKENGDQQKQNNDCLGWGDLLKVVPATDI